ncbi:MAG: ABC transporter permease [Vicinamibacteria bacterium]|nr:ABC transporter permease [Vicinamibacteria bacterium]
MRLRFAWQTARRELRHQPSRLLLLALPVAIGVAALVSVSAFEAGARAALQREARGLLGADLALGANRPFTAGAEQQLAALQAEAGPGVRLSRATSFGAMARVAGRDGARLVQVSAIEGGFPFHGNFRVTPAAARERLAADPAPALLVDPSLLASLDVAVGERLELGALSFEIAGTFEGWPGDLAFRTAFGPRVVIDARHVAATGLIGFGARVRHEVYLALAEGRDPVPLVAAYRPRLARERVTLRSPRDDEQRAGEALARMSRFLGLVGFAALLLGGLGTAAGVHAFVRRALPSLAVLRAIGASWRDLAAALGFQVGLAGLLAGLVGSGLGLVVARALPRLLGDWLPVVVEPAAAPLAIASGLATGVLAMFAFSALPLLAIRDVPALAVLREGLQAAAPRPWRDPARATVVVASAATLAALAVVQARRVGPGLAFAGGAALVALVLALVARLLVRALARPLPAALPYAVRQGLANLQRPGHQTTPVVVALGFGGFLLALMGLVEANLVRGLDLGDAAGRANVVVFEIQPDQVEAITADLRARGAAPDPAVPIVAMRLSSVKGASVSDQLGETDAEGEDRRPRGLLRREYRSSYRDHATAAETTVAGERWAEGAGRALRPDEPVPVSLDAGLAAELGVGVGDELVWDVSGVPLPSRVTHLRRTDWTRIEPNFFAVFPAGVWGQRSSVGDGAPKGPATGFARRRNPTAPLEVAPRTFVTLARLESAADRGRAQRELLERFPNLAVLDVTAVRASVEGLLRQVALAVRFMAGFSLVVGAVVLAAALLALRRERLREAALLKTLGATRAQVRAVAVVEGMALGLLAAISASALALGLGLPLLETWFELEPAVPWAALVTLSAGLAAGSGLAGVLTAAEAFRRTPLELLRAE